MKALFKNIIDAPAATFGGAITAALGVFIASDLAMPKILLVTLMALSAFLSIFSGPNKPSVNTKGDGWGNIGLVLFFLGFVGFCLPSCTPQGYVVDTRPYVEAIKASPDAVSMKPEHVTPLGGISTDIRGSIVTEQGTVGISDGVLYTDLVIDVTPGK